MMNTAAASLAARPLRGASARSPNILLIMADQLRKDTLGCYGNPLIHTPNIDRIAAAGVRFERNIIQNPVCQPSRSSILTGRYPHSHRVWTNGMSLPSSEVTVAEYLRRTGYHTGVFGKLHLDPQLKGPPVRMSAASAPYYGFDVFHITEDPKVGEYLDFIDTFHPSYSAAVRKTNATLPVEIHQSAWIAGRTIDFIQRARKNDRPFFGLCSFVDPHHGCDPPPPYNTMYKPEELPAPRRRAGELDDKPPYFRQFADLYADAKGVNTSEESVRKFASQYYGEISLLDAQIGRILKALEKTGALENTIIAFTADHGDMLGDHWLIYKGAFHYDCLINTPLLISWPAALPKGRTVTALTEEVDIAPTLLDLAGLPPPPGMQGVSLVPLGKGERSSLKQATLTEANAPGGQSSDLQRYAVTVKTLRTEEWKLTFHQGHDYGELYDLKNDPNEFVNLWSKPAYRERRDQLVAQLLDTLVRTEDPLPLRNYDY